MTKTVTSRIENSRRLKKITISTLCLAFCLRAGWNGYRFYSNPERPHGAVRSRTEIGQRAMRIGTALRGSAQILTQPVLQVGKDQLDIKGQVAPNRWAVLCEADHQQMNMLFDDKTGRMVCLITERPYGNARRHEQSPTLDTEDAAVTTAVDRLRAMETLPADAEIALRGRPRQETHHRAWEVDWLVRTPTLKQPYTVKVVLDRITGQPLYMIDMMESG